MGNINNFKWKLELKNILKIDLHFLAVCHNGKKKKGGICKASETRD